ncbi:ATPases of the AAA+ class [hydrothermal vent metagenome]|uniref:ATPases of the AAA+ class n=1 Tax=hydrothermal vent metagenome TaxID=652676 RepID=A0A1W1CR72_9ZZZZ
MNTKNKSITLLGMSGVGKTHLSNLLRNTGDWFHYSGDYRIGSRYLDEPILDNIKLRMMQDSFLKPLLMSDSIYINNNITFDNLLPVSTFLGNVGNPHLGGLPLDEFKKRQQQHFDAETNAMLDVPSFIEKAKNIYGYPNFVNDAGGSLCELDDEVFIELNKHTKIIYIKTNKEDEEKLISRALKKPKPLFFNKTFLDESLNKYLKEFNLDYVAEINPIEFSKWVFPKLFYYRLPKYEVIAKKYGITITSKDLYLCKSVDDFFKLIEK